MKEKQSDIDPVMICGKPVACGCYLLRIQVVEPIGVRFGRFQGGQAVAVAAGAYLYIGSAMGKKGAATLPQRLLRHATRHNGTPHAIRPLLLEKLRAAGLGTNRLQAPARKTLFWHIDYLLEETAVTLTHIIILRTNTSLENQLARLLAADPQTAPFINGLGASDDPGQTHLLRVPNALSWWQEQADLVAAIDHPQITE